MNENYEEYELTEEEKREMELIEVFMQGHVNGREQGRIDTLQEISNNKNKAEGILGAIIGMLVGIGINVGKEKIKERRRKKKAS